MNDTVERRRLNRAKQGPHAVEISQRSRLKNPIQTKVIQYSIRLSSRGKDESGIQQQKLVLGPRNKRGLGFFTRNKEGEDSQKQKKTRAQKYHYKMYLLACTNLTPKPTSLFQVPNHTKCIHQSCLPYIRTSDGKWPGTYT